MDIADVGMIESRCSLRFMNETLFGFFVSCEIRRKEFECDGSLEGGVFGFVHHTHASNTKLLEYFVPLSGIPLRSGIPRSGIV
jgi:hypothetical protein